MNYKRIMLTMLLGEQFSNSMHRRFRKNYPQAEDGMSDFVADCRAVRLHSFRLLLINIGRGGMQDFPEVTDLTPYFLSKVY